MWENHDDTIVNSMLILTWIFLYIKELPLYNSNQTYNYPHIEKVDPAYASSYHVAHT